MSAVMSELPQPHRITVQEYYRMAESGFFAPDAHVELIQGEVFDMPPMGELGGGITTYLTRQLMYAAGDRAEVRVQLPVHLDEFSLPEPDFALVLPRKDSYTRSHPGPQDILLLIEVSDSTLRFDLKRKLELYAEHQVPEYWVVDLKNSRLRQFCKPDAGLYAETVEIEKPGIVAIARLPGVSVDLSRLFSLS